jgi:selenocysteine lyase/cysteine desulfurase
MGIQFIRARDAAAGGADVEDVERLIKQHRPVLVSVSHVPSSSGLIQPVEDIGRFCRAEGIWYLVDACQSAGQLVLDVNKIGCDFLSAATRKFMRGPRGGGFLFASDRALEAGLEPLLPDMHGAKWTGPDSYQSVPDARRFEYWEMSGAILLGSKAAAEYALSVGMDWIQATVTSLAAYTRNRLAEIPDVQVLDHGEKLSGIVTCYCKNWDSKTLLPHLSARNIHCRVSSHGVAQIDFSRKKVPWALRISPHYYNTEAEIDATIDVLKSMPNAAHT